MSHEVAGAEALEASRKRNLRQLLLQASRMTNRHVVEGLHARGYAKLRSTHTTLLSNLDLTGGSVTEVAHRAGISKQAMGRLAGELETAGYLQITVDPDDARARLLTLTEAGKSLMLDSFSVMTELERRYAALIGDPEMRGIVEGLVALVAADHERRVELPSDTASTTEAPIYVTTR